jgi:hypothetical protein
MRKHTARQQRDPMGWITRRTPIADDQQRDLGIAYHASLQALLTGHGTEQSWSTLACALNIAMLLSERNIGASLMPTIKLAQDALLRSRERAQRTGKWAFDGDGIRVVLAAVNIHDEQISRASRAQILAAIDEVHIRVMAGEAA